MTRSLDSEVILSLFKLLLTNILLSKRLQTYNGIVKKYGISLLWVTLIQLTSTLLKEGIEI